MMAKVIHTICIIVHFPLKEHAPDFISLHCPLSPERTCTRFYIVAPMHRCNPVLTGIDRWSDTEHYNMYVFLTRIDVTHPSVESLEYESAVLLFTINQIQMQYKV